MIKIAIIGAGRMGNVHAEALSKNALCSIYGIYDPSNEAAEKFKQKYKLEKIYASLAELVDDSSVDGVIVCNYTDQHHQTLLKLLNGRKKFIFCEKALMRHLAEGEDILKYAADSDSKIMIGHHRRYIPGYAKLKTMIEAGDLGTIRMTKINCNVAGYARGWDDFFANFMRSGGVTLDMMTHHLDLLNWYFGEVESADSSSVMFASDMPLPMDFVSGTVVYKNGVICNICGSWQRYGVSCDTIEVYGDQACAVFDLESELVHVYRKNEHTEIKVGNPPCYTTQMNAFVDMIANGTPPLTMLQDGFNSAKIALGMIESAEKNIIIKF